MSVTVDIRSEALPQALNGFVRSLEQRLNQSKTSDAEITVVPNGGGNYEVEVRAHGTAYEVDESGDEPTIRQISGRRPVSEMVQDVMDDFFVRDTYPQVYADDTVAEVSFDVSLPEDVDK